MTFDHDHKPDRSMMSASIAALVDRAFYSRRPRGLNVQFIKDDGGRDEWSFATIAGRDEFIAREQRNGVTCFISS